MKTWQYAVLFKTKKIMNIKELIQILDQRDEWSLQILLPNGKSVPANFHITEVGRVQKNFIDCGGTKRELVTCLLQVWTANDIDHRLKAGKLSRILKLAESVIGQDDLPVEIEYGAMVASQYKLTDIDLTQSQEMVLLLDGKLTECLAVDKCGVSGCC